MNPFNGPRQRVLRVTQDLMPQLSEMHRVEENRYHIAPAEKDRRTDRYALRVIAIDEVQPTLPVWSLVIGEVAHHLRAALDGLFWELARRRYAESILLKNRQDIEFPLLVARKNQTHEQRLKSIRKRTRWLTPDDAALVDWWQPFRPGNGGTRSNLWLLQELNNADKHRVLQVCAAEGLVGRWLASGNKVTSRPEFLREYGREVGYHFRQPLTQGARVGWVSALGIEGVHRAEFTASGHVVFWDGCRAVRGMRPQNLLHRAISDVESVIRFAEIVSESNG